MSFVSNWSSSVYKAKKTRSSKFLREMDVIMPWNRITKRIEEIRNIFTNREELGGRPYENTLVMIKMLCLASRYNLSDELVEDYIYDRASFQEFLDIDITTQNIPDSTTLCRFRAFLNENELQEDIFNIINNVLGDAGLMVKEGTIIDSTIVQAPSSTKNEEGKRDPEMHSTKKGNNYYFGMKVHGGADIKNGLIHSICVTPANVHDSQIYEEVLNGNEEITVGDSAYTGEKIDNIANKRGIDHLHSPKGRRLNRLTFRDIAYGKIVASMRAKGEFTWGIIKNLRGYKKTKYKGLAKNSSHWYLLCGLSNIYRMRYKLMSI